MSDPLPARHPEDAIAVTHPAVTADGQGERRVSPHPESRAGMAAVSAPASATGMRLVGGAYDGLSAALVERAGFDAVWASGFSISASKLLPDCSAMAIEDLVAAVAEMTRAVRLPVLVDCDEGYGDLENTRRLARRLAACGAAGVCIEDSRYPKINSFCDEPGRALADIDDYARKLQAIRAAAPELVVVARTESLIADQPLAAALDRAMYYAELGADFVVIHSRFTEFDEFRCLVQAWKGPVPLVAIPTLSRSVSWRDLLDVGFGMVIYANQALRASVRAQERVLRDILGTGAVATPERDLASIEHLFGLTRLREVARLTGPGE